MRLKLASKQTETSLRKSQMGADKGVRCGLGYHTEGTSGPVGGGQGATWGTPSQTDKGS